MNKRTLLLLFIFLLGLSILIHKSVIKYVYVSPEVNTKSLIKSTKIIKSVDNNLDKIMSFCNKEFKDMKYEYKNYYGSGFLKENTIPNDLDTSVGINLGYYEYNGKNLEDISKSLEKKVSAWHLYSYIVFATDKQKKYIIDDGIITKLGILANKKNENIKNISSGLKEVLSGNVQVIHKNKLFNKVNVDYTFILNKGEVLISDIPSLYLLSKEVIYNDTMKDYPREITVLPDFFVTIKDTTTNKINKIELIEESFMGQRFQISRRFFVPIVFTGNNSLSYLKNLDYLNDNKKFVDVRMFNFFRYLNEVQTHFDITVEPIKLLKRLHQCADIISPALTKEQRNKIYSDIRKVMQNEDIKLVNDYSVAMKNINKIMSNKYIFDETNKSGYLSELLDISNYSLQALSKNKNYIEEIKKLSEYQYQVIMMIKGLNSPEKLKELHDYMDNNYITVTVELTKIINKNIQNRQDFVDDFNILQNISDNAGFHKIKLYYADQNVINIAKNDFTKKLTQNDIQKMVKENDLPSARYNLVEEKDIAKTNMEEIHFVRYNSTKSQDEYWNNLQQILIQDKSNFKIKHKYWL
ncbi:MAG: hypothetical protein ACI37S_03075 [Candidatus Gastranaerophilaceae bacterium]